ncbi:MAG: DnaJ C-terminal domain-containing protein, partial [Ktedonobacteraceae bacterium]
MAYQGQQNGDIRATLAVSQAEALAGTQRKLNLPDGRQVIVNIAAGTHDGQEIRLEGEGQPSGYGNERGALILTIAIADGEQVASETFPQQGSDSPTQFIQPPPPPLVVPGKYPAAEARDRNAHYPMPGQQTFYANQTQQAGQVTPVYNPPPAQTYTQYIPPGGQTPRRSGLSKGVIALLVILVLLLIGASGIIIYATAIRPAQLQAQATSTAQAKLTGTAQGEITRTAQAAATAQAYVNATSTAVAQATNQAKATATALQSIYTQTTSGSPSIDDPLTQQDSIGWEVDTKTGGGGCAFSNGSYHASMPQAGFFAPCYAQNRSFNNFAYQVQMTILKGDRGGLIFRSDGSNKFYLFRVDQNGEYDLFLYTSSNTNSTKNLLTGTATNIMHT